MGPLQAPSAGFVLARAVSLIWDIFLSHIKNREMGGGGLALGGCRFINIFNNQMEVGVWGRRCIEHDLMPGWNMRGGVIFSFGAVNCLMKQKKIHCGLRRPPFQIFSHNNQPKT
jgi:hypothetical protein